MRALEVTDLVKEFPTGYGLPPNRVIEDISFEMDMGDRMAIIGPNGCGKTTLLKTLATIYLPDSGSIKLFSQDMIKNRSRARKTFSFVSPSLNFQSKLTLSQTISYFATVLQKPPEIVIPFLKRTNLYKMWNSRIESFSEGQKAILRLALGFLKQPKILFLDEVVANLDVSRKESVINIIEEMEAYQDLTLVMVDHDPYVVDRLCSKILVLKGNGTVHSLSSVSDLMNKLHYNFSVDVTLKSDIPDSKALSISKAMRKNNLKIRYFAEDEKKLKTIINKLISLGPIIQEFTTSSVSMRDVYYLLFEGGLDEGGV
mgnify:FL=1|tara:strand:- start:1431 stop:2372 length:942 start_codon:yes stop_codon:yes gene_type:complete